MFSAYVIVIRYICIFNTRAYDFNVHCKTISYVTCVLCGAGASAVFALRQLIAPPAR